MTPTIAALTVANIAVWGGGGRYLAKMQRAITYNKTLRDTINRWRGMKPKTMITKRTDDGKGNIVMKCR